MRRKAEMKMYRVVTEFPSRTNPREQQAAELFESEEEALRHVSYVCLDQDLYGLEPGETLRLEIYDAEPAEIIMYGETEQ
jgi:hypothetical protein